MGERYYHHRGGFLQHKHVMFLKAAASYVRLGWWSMAARPTDPLTVALIDACDAGKTVKQAVDELPTYPDGTS